MAGGWLFKSEPDVFSIDDLQRQGTSMWEGVRNYQARNFLRQAKVGERVFIYHSSCKQPGIAGIGEIAREAYPDPTQFDPASDYHDSASTPEKPRWSAVDVRFVDAFPRVITLESLRQQTVLEDWALLQKGSRLSVMPVTPAQWQAVLQLLR